MSENPIDPKLPSAADVLKQLKSSAESRSNFETIFINKFSKGSITSETEYAHLIGIQDHYKHKKNWSWFIIMIMLFMVLFQMILIVNVGRDIWDYRSYDWLLPTLMIQYFGQIIGLAWLIVKSLFTKIN